MYKQTDIPGTATAFPYVVPKAVSIAEAAAAASAGAGGGAGGGGGSSGGAGGGAGGGSGEQWTKLDLSAAIPDVISNVTDGLDSILGGIDKLITFITPVLNIIEMFLSLFSSFTKAAVALVDALEEIIKPLKESLGQAGVYMNVIVPPALQKIGTASFNMSRLSSGGFNGFISRLNLSLNDPEDIQKPPFGPGGIVGGAVILVDGTSPEKIFQALQHLAKMFDFMKLFGLQLDPPPPRNLRGYPTFFEKDGKTGYCIKLQWDKPPSFAMRYMLTRSQAPKGRARQVDAWPTKIVGKDGWLAFMRHAMATRVFTPPQKTIYVYDDPQFNKGQPVFLGGNLDGGGEYLDFDFDITIKDGKWTKGPKCPGTVYYVVQSVCAPIDLSVLGDVIDPPGLGPKSSVLKVPVRMCNSIGDSAEVIQHSGGFFEFLAPGFGAVSRWTSVQMGLTIPWIGELVDIVTKFLDQMKGLATDSSDSFVQFVKQIKDKITSFIQMLRLFAKMITEIKNILSGLPTIAFLFVPPAPGGNAEFLRKVKTAKVPAGAEPFSGPDGITVGIVLMFGYDSSIAEAYTAGAPARADLQAQFDVLNTAFNTLAKFFGV